MQITALAEIGIAGLHWVLALPVIAIIWVLMQGLTSGWTQLTSSVSWSGLTMAFVRTSLVAFAVAVLVPILLGIIAFFDERGVARKLLGAHLSPSVVLIGFALLWATGSQDPSGLIRLTIGSVFLLMPFLWRLHWKTALRALEQESAVAKTLGASVGQIATDILFPRLWPQFIASGALAGLWVWGDFALATIVVSGGPTAGLLAQALMNSYRFEAAALVICGILVCGGLQFALFSVIGRRFQCRM